MLCPKLVHVYYFVCQPCSIKMLCSFKMQKALFCNCPIVIRKNKINQFFLSYIFSFICQKGKDFAFFDFNDNGGTHHFCYCFQHFILDLAACVLSITGFLVFTTVSWLPRISNIAKKFPLLLAYTVSLWPLCAVLCCSQQLHFSYTFKIATVFLYFFVCSWQLIVKHVLFSCSLLKFVQANKALMCEQELQSLHLWT